jgi:hypothetical protein
VVAVSFLASLHVIGSYLKFVMEIPLNCRLTYDDTELYCFSRSKIYKKTNSDWILVFDNKTPLFIYEFLLVVDEDRLLFITDEYQYKILHLKTKKISNIKNGDVSVGYSKCFKIKNGCVVLRERDCLSLLL